MPFISPTAASEQSLALFRSMTSVHHPDDKLPTIPKYFDSGYTSNPGTNINIKRTRSQEKLLANNPFTTEYRPGPFSTDVARVDPYLLTLSDDDETNDNTPSMDSDRLDMVRKKSGLVVKSSLKNTRRARSLPSTPTCFKEVHFDAQLERVRHFFRSERPAAISNEVSPTERYPLATSFPFEDQDEMYRIDHSPFSSDSKSPVHVELVHLSSAGDTLVGQILVENIAYHKSVVVRFTFDQWMTISEVNAFYEDQHNDGTIPKDHRFDRFTFNIKLRDFVNVSSDSQSMDFCVRYHVANQEFWDNNSGSNYRINFFRCNCETERLRSNGSATPTLNGESSPPAVSGFFGLFNEHLESMAEFDDTELWAASFRRHAIPLLQSA